MRLRTLAAKNVRHRAQSYAAFFLSSAFAVWLFYLYASLLQHPHFQDRPLPPSFSAGMRAVATVVGGFSVLFIVHAHAAFLKARKKELALMALLGMRPAQIARTIHLENAIVGLAATTLGVLVGTACLKLFFLAFSRVIGLREPVPFHFSLSATGLTYLVFAGVFALISLYTQVTLRRTSLADLLRAGNGRTALPRLSRWQGVAGLLALGGAYMLLLTTASPWESAARILWILGLLLVGTYLFFTQSSILVLRWLQANRSLYYRETNLITISQLSARLYGNARMLFMISMLTAGILLPLGLFALQLSHAEASVLHGDPVHLMVVGEPNGVTPARVTTILREHGLLVAGEAHIPTLTARTQDAKNDAWGTPMQNVLVMPAEGFNRWLVDVLRKAPFTLEPGRAVLVERWGGTNGTWTTIH
ncbi:MAG TPA: ABC transporter permease, partial [Chloroflexota bacterium]|nr:ABC transporter permease [Chloroflexota bacterium]